MCALYMCVYIHTYIWECVCVLFIGTDIYILYIYIYGASQQQMNI